MKQSLGTCRPAGPQSQVAVESQPRSGGRRVLGALTAPDAAAALPRAAVTRAGTRIRAWAGNGGSAAVDAAARAIRVSGAARRAGSARRAPRCQGPSTRGPPAAARPPAVRHQGDARSEPRQETRHEMGDRHAGSCSALLCVLNPSDSHTCTQALACGAPITRTSQCARAFLSKRTHPTPANSHGQRRGCVRALVPRPGKPSAAACV